MGDFAGLSGNLPWCKRFWGFEGGLGDQLVVKLNLQDYLASLSGGWLCMILGGYLALV